MPPAAARPVAAVQTLFFSNGNTPFFPRNTIQLIFLELLMQRGTKFGPVLSELFKFNIAFEKGKIHVISNQLMLKQLAITCFM